MILLNRNEIALTALDFTNYKYTIDLISSAAPDSKFDSILVFKPIINQELFTCDLFALGVGSWNVSS